ncbi:MAG: YjgN family protein [Candidatus Eisenbacteria bacterium]
MTIESADAFVPGPKQATRPTTAPPWEFRFRGKGGELFGISLMNGILSVITLGIWFAWGRVRELQFLVGNTVADGDPMSFHGRGGELFRGVVIAFFAFIVPIYALFLMSGFLDTGWSALAMVAGYALFIVLIAFATVGSLRYRLPRIEWRGIRFGFDGRSRAFLRGYLPRILLVGVTLGFAYPFYACWRRRWILAQSRFGTEHFACDAEPGALYPEFVVMYLLGFVTFGLTWVYYYGQQQAYLWDRSRLGAAKFSTTLTGGNWLGLMFTNGLLSLVTLGIAMPWVVVRTHRFFFEHLSLEGSLDLGAVRQRLQRSGGVGEGMLDALDLDSGLDLG